MTREDLRLINRRANWKLIRVPVVILCLLVLSVVILDATGYRVNWTESEPVGIYRVLPVTDGIDAGDRIEFCYTGERQPFMTRGVCSNGTAPFFKSVVAVPGDLVVVGVAGVMVNGLMLPDSRPLSHSISDPQLTLPVLRGRFVLGENEYWSYGSGSPERSFDSRYFGAVKLNDIRFVSKK